MLSVIVPIYNVSKFIRDMVFTLNNQTLREFEVLFIDDGSTDDSIEVLNNRLASEKPRFQYVIHRKENGGLSDARNYGLKKSQYKYVTFLDPDDWLSDNFYEDLLSNMLRNNCDISVSSFIEEWPTHSRPFIYSRTFTSPSMMSSCLWVYTWSACTKIFKKNLFDNSNFDFGIYHEDLALIPYIMSKANKIYVSDITVYHYRRHTESILGSHNKKKELDTIIALDKMYFRLKDQNREFEARFILVRVLVFSFIPNIFYKYKNSERTLLINKAVSYLKLKKITHCDLYRYYLKGYFTFSLFLLSVSFITFPRVISQVIALLYKFYKRG